MQLTAKQRPLVKERRNSAKGTVEKFLFLFEEVRFVPVTC